MGEEEHIDANLLSAEFNGSLLVPSGIWAQKLNFHAGSHHLLIFSWLERSIAKIWLNRLEDAHFSTDLFHDGKGSLQSRSKARLRHDGIVRKHFGKTVQKGIHNGS